MIDPAFRAQAQPRRSPWRIGLYVYALLGLSACQSAAPSPAQSGSSEAELLRKINDAIGLAACSTDSQCRTIAIGVNACGGPAAWRAWSTQMQTQKERENLQTLADQIAALQRARHAQSGMVATCRHLPDPGAVCQAQRCVLITTTRSDS